METLSTFEFALLVKKMGWKVCSGSGLVSSNDGYYTMRLLDGGKE